MKKFLFLLLTALLCYSTYAQQRIRFEKVSLAVDWAMVLDKSRELSKPIFVDIYTDWCGYCKLMDKNVFSDQEVIEFMNKNFINVKVDGESTFGRGFCNTHQVEGFPTYAFIGGNNRPLHYLEGYVEKEALLAASKEVGETYQQVLSYDQAYGSGTLSNEELMSYYSLSADDARREEIANRLFESYAGLENPDKEFVHFLSSTEIIVNDRAYSFIKKHQDAIREEHGEEEVEELVNKIYESTLTKAILSKDKELLDLVLEELIPSFLSPETRDLAQYDSRKIYHAYTNDWDAYEDIVSTRLAEVPSEEKGAFLYNEGLVVVNDYKESELALRKAEGWLETSAGLENDFDSNILTAYVKAILADLENARKFLSKATELAKSDDDKALIADVSELISTNE